MASQNTYNIGFYYTNVDLAQGLMTNLAEIELALKYNPNSFSGLMLLDQARGITDEEDIVYSYRTSAFPTGWNGTDTYRNRGFSNDIWRDTGIAHLEASKISDDNLTLFKSYAEANKESYAGDVVTYLLNRTGSSFSEFYPSFNSPSSAPEELDGIHLGISTPFTVLPEMQTGSPESVDFLLEESRNSSGFQDNPHAIFLSNHGGSYLSGGNGDGPDYDIDQSKRLLQVTELAESLTNSIQASHDKSRFGLIAYDECLMANVETLTELGNASRYFLASQEIIPGNGYDYFLTLSDFNVTGDLATQEQIEAASLELGNAFVGTYSERNGITNTLSLTDSDSIAPLNQAIKNYADAFINSSDVFIVSLLKSIRHKGTNYAIDWLQDLGNVALITRSAPGVSQELVNASDEILFALNNTVVSNNQSYRPLEGFKLNHSSGLTITLPTEHKDWNNDSTQKFKEKAPAFESATGWSLVLDRITPLLADVQTNDGNESSKAVTKNAFLSKKFGSTASLALQLEGNLRYSSTDEAINQSQFDLPNLQNATIHDLTFYLDVLSLKNVGEINMSLRDREGITKASWALAIQNDDIYALQGSELSDSISSLPINEGDHLIITPDRAIEARYDLYMFADDQVLGDIESYRPNQKRPAIETTPVLLNLNLSDKSQRSFRYLTPNSPNNEPFITDIVLVPNGNGKAYLTIKDAYSSNEVVFESRPYIDEYIKLNGNSLYEFTLEYVATIEDAPSELSSDTALLVDYYSSDAGLLKDSILSASIELADWGEYTINQSLTGDTLVTQMSADSAFESINDLTEGESIKATFKAHTVNRDSDLQQSKSGGNNTIFSGLWTSSSNFTLNTSIKGTSANNARFGFYEVDTLTGGIITENGMVVPADNDAYRNAAIDRLVSPLTDLVGINKSASLRTNLDSGSHYAAILITADAVGRETALFSIASANPNQSVQLLDLGNGYYGWEDLVKGVDKAYDGDFNDLTFYTS